MATRAVSTLSRNDLADLYKVLYSAKNKCRSFGLQIGVGFDEIVSIEKQHTDLGDRLLEVLSARLNQAEPLTWNDIDTALRLECVGESRTADGIRKKYPQLFSPDPSIVEGSSDQEYEGQMHVKKGKTKKKRRRKKPKADRPLHMSDEQEEDSDEEVSGRVKRKKTKKCPKQPESNDDSSAVSSIEITEELEKEREKAETFSAPERKIHKREKKKGKMKKVEYKERKEQPEPPEVYEREEKKKRNAKVKKKAAHEKGKSLRYEFSDIASDDHEFQSSDVNQKSKKQKLPQQVRVGPGKESSRAQKEMPFHSDTRQKESQSAQRVESKSKDKSVEMHAKRKTKDEMRKEHSATRKATAEGYERQQYSHGREVSEKTKRKKEVDPDSDSQNEPSSTSTSEEETSEIAGVESTAPKSKPSVSHTQQPIDCGKEIERKRSKRKQMLLEEQQHWKGKSATHRLTEKTKASIAFSDEKYSVKKGRHTKKKNQKEKLPGQKALESASESTQEDSRDEESAESSEDEEGRQEEEETEPDVDNTSVESRIQKSKPSVSHTQKPKDIKKEIERKRSSKKHTLPEEQEHLEGKRATQRLTEETKTSITFSGEKSIKSKGRETEHRKKTSQKEKLKLEEKEKLPGQKALESASESTQEDSQESDGGSEDDRISEHLQSSKEEEETEPDDESSTATSEEGVKVNKKPIAKESESQDSTTKGTRKGKGKRVKVAHPVDSLKDRELSAPGSCGKEQKEQEEHEMQPKKKRTRRNHGESGMSPIARGSSSPSTSQEDNQKQCGAKGQGKQKRKKKKERLPCSSEFDDSSPVSDKVKNLPDAEKKKLSGIFTCFFGELCCAVVDPVETAAQLQKKSLISRATMIEILKSPESQRDKTIGLVSNLEKKMDSCPDCLFVLIEVLLQNEALQRTGNEMLREAGKYRTTHFVLD